MYEEYRCGMYAGFASIFGKLCFSNSIDSLPGMGALMASCTAVAPGASSADSGTGIVLNKCLLMYGFSRLVVGGLMVVCSFLQVPPSRNHTLRRQTPANGALQFVNFMKALERKGSLIVTVIASAVSFIITGVLGMLIGERCVL